jgi:hypothetical protein
MYNRIKELEAEIKEENQRLSSTEMGAGQRKWKKRYKGSIPNLFEDVNDESSSQLFFDKSSPRLLVEVQELLVTAVEEEQMRISQ